MTITWTPASSVGWVDLDRDEAERVKELLGLFKAPEAIDPHGILPLQIALSDRLFPGMSTQHTRARYVFFTAWHAQRLAALSGRQIRVGRLRLEELELMRSLLANDDPNDGVFGRRTRDKTQTLPCGVYWSALQAWEIVPVFLTLSDVQQFQAVTRSRQSRVQRSDDAAHIEKSIKLLPDDFPEMPSGFPASDQHIRLRTDEAEYLCDRVAASSASKGTLLATVFVRTDLAGDQHEFPWSADPDAGGEALNDARRFSELIHPARLMYSKSLVNDGRGRSMKLEDIAKQLDDEFVEWREEIDSEIGALRDWAKSRLPILLDDPSIRLSVARKHFIKSAVDLTAAEPDRCWSGDQSEALEREVRAIEVAVKRQHARLVPGPPFERWLKQPAPIAAKRLDYRWGNVQRFARDIEEAA